MKSHRYSIRKRVERLEAILPKPVTTTYRTAFIVIGEFDGERHLVMTSSPDAQPSWFEESAGPGPQLTDFGEFETVLYLTADEAML